jgi:zinc transport system substrate-binding protein
MHLLPVPVLGLLALTLLPSPGRTTAPEAGLQVVVSILPQQFLVERIAGERVKVLVLVRPGDNEATYTPGPATLAALDGAHAWFTIGVPFEDAWQGRIARDRPAMEIVPLADGLPQRAMDGAAGEAHGHRHEGRPDPHTWTDPRLAARMAGTIAAALARLDPAGAAAYQAGARALQDELQALHAEIANQLEAVRGRTFIVFHPSWGYFADAYGLVQLPIELGGREPGPRSLAELVSRGRAAGARAVFVQPQFSKRSATAVAQALGVELIEADPLAPDYIANLRGIAASMAAALADPPPAAQP